MSASSYSTDSIACALVVSDDSVAIELLTEGMRDLAISTQACSDVRIALELLNGGKFEVVIVDLRTNASAREIIENLSVSRANRTAITFVIVEGDSPITAQSSASFTLKAPLGADQIARTLKAAYGLIVRERRRYFRCPINTDVVIGNDANMVCEAVNVSEGGMAIRSRSSFKPGMRLDINFTLEGEPAEFSSKAEVCWTGDRGMAGLQFLDLREEQKSKLLNWLSRRLEQSMPENVADKFRNTSAR